MAVAPTKNISRYEWFLEKATEIGVQQITPIFCTRSERKSLKPRRLEKVIEAAMKQSLRAYLPRLNPAVSYPDFISQEREGLCFIAHCEKDEKTDLKRRMGADQDVTILIGPEGDFTHEEIKNAYAHGFRPISLGDGRLRTETAALVACTTVAVINSG
jgi:16S rRNA (uracil1498-N3)-methyltransferase